MIVCNILLFMSLLTDPIVKNSNIEARIYFIHGIIIRTGITCKKIPCYMRESACRWLIVENAKKFQSYVKYF